MKLQKTRQRKQLYRLLLTNHNGYQQIFSYFCSNQTLT
jgi:hypothetical protein